MDNSIWEIKQNEKYGYYIRPKQSFKCNFCNSKMYIHAFVAQYYPPKNFYHVDINVKCPKCGWFTIFGVAISKKEYEQLKSSKLNGVTLTDELFDVEDLTKEEEEMLQKRLKSLGYWG